MLFSCSIYGQTIKIIDSQTKDSLPFASLVVNNGALGLIADYRGIIDLSSYELELNKADDTLCISYTGYKNYCFSFSAFKQVFTQKNQVIVIALELFNTEMPPLVFSPPNADSLLLYSCAKMFEVFKTTQWQKLLGRDVIFVVRNNLKAPQLISESFGEMFSNQLTIKLFTGARSNHRWINKLHTRTAFCDSTVGYPYPFRSENFINYSLTYFFPFSPQLFDKKLEKVFDKSGNITHFKITLFPERKGFLGKIYIADYLLRSSYENLLRTRRTFFINTSDTTITEMHIEDLKTYNIKRKSYELSQKYSTCSFVFDYTQDGAIYLSYATRNVKWFYKTHKTNYETLQQYWFEKPEYTPDMSIAEIERRTGRVIRTNNFNTNKTYYFTDSEFTGTIKNDNDFWRTKKMPDFSFIKSIYKEFANCKGGHLFSD